MNAIHHHPSHTQELTIDTDLRMGQISTASHATESTDPQTPTAERDHHLFVRTTTQRYGCTYVSPQEHDFIYWLIRAERLVDEIVRSDEPPVELVSTRRRGEIYQLTKLGHAIFYLFKSYNRGTAGYYRHHRFNPALTLMLKVVDGCSSELVERSQNGAPVPSDPRTREILEIATASIRTSGRSQAFKDEVDNYRRNEEKNITSCCEYLAAQFQRRSQLLVLRVDLNFRQSFQGWGYTCEADRHYARFLRALRENRIVPDVLGYISKREDGINRGIHFHVLIVLDGHKHRDAANLSRMVGEDWVRRCGYGELDDGVDVGATEEKAKASYFNCYTRANQYQFNCLGLIHPTDAGKLRGLRLAIEYLCKETTQLKPSPPESGEAEQAPDIASRRGIRNLRKGIMPKGHSGRGAPRSSGLDTTFIVRELLQR